MGSLTPTQYVLYMFIISMNTSSNALSAIRFGASLITVSLYSVTLIILSVSEFSTSGSFMILVITFGINLLSSSQIWLALAMILSKYFLSTTKRRKSSFRYFFIYSRKQSHSFKTGFTSFYSVYLASFLNP